MPVESMPVFQQKANKGARKSYIRNSQELSCYMQSLRSSIRNMFANCERFCWTFQFMLESRAKLLTGKWDRLTAIDQASIFGYWEALADTLWNKLEGRYLINGKYYLPNEVIDGKDGTDTSRDVQSGAKNYHKVFVVNTESGPEYRIYY